MFCVWSLSMFSCFAACSESVLLLGIFCFQMACNQCDRWPFASYYINWANWKKTGLDNYTNLNLPHWLGGSGIFHFQLVTLCFDLSVCKDSFKKTESMWGASYLGVRSPMGFKNWMMGPEKEFGINSKSVKI